LPPVADEATGDVLVDGGYLNPIPVDVMREKMGVETVIVVDVEDEDYLAFRNLTPHDGGLGGWRLLWDRATEPTRASLARLADAWRDFFARARGFGSFLRPRRRTPPTVENTRARGERRTPAARRRVYPVAVLLRSPRTRRSWTL
jgi:lysophospholipid hydrolase